MTDTPRAYRAICFDLDGTLLPMDLDEFMKSYFAAVGAFVGARGIDAEAFMKALWDGTRSMLHHNDERTNAEAYWDTFYSLMDKDAANWEELLTEFYEGPFGELGRDVEPDPAVTRTLVMLTEKGYPLVLTTMPMFPPEAVRWRLRWAGVDPELFCRLTTYDNSTAVKPKERYYAENLAALGLAGAGADVLMVGNNTVEDLAFTKLGADAYLVTDWLLDPTECFDLSTVRHGTSADFAAWAETLPPCENPATGVNPGPVDPAQTAEALAAAGIAPGAAAQAIDKGVKPAGYAAAAQAVASSKASGGQIPSGDQTTPARETAAGGGVATQVAAAGSAPADKTAAANPEEA